MVTGEGLVYEGWITRFEAWGLGATDRPPVQRSMSTTTVQRVRSFLDRERFLKLPMRLYRNDPLWVPPLILEQRLRLNRWSNPYFRHADAAFFLAKRDGQTIGRISAQHCRRACEFQGEGSGHFGFFESEPEAQTASLLFDAAADWLRKRSMKTMTGPFNLSINDEAGIQVDGRHRPPAIFMGHHPESYDQLLSDAGMTGVMDLHAYYLDLAKPYTRRVERIVQSARKDRRIHLRTIDRRQASRQLPHILKLFNEAWSENWGHVPMTDLEVKHMISTVSRLFDSDSLLIAEVDGEVAGMIMTLPDANQWTHDLGGRLTPTNCIKLLSRLWRGRSTAVRVPLMGIRKSLQSTRLGALVALAMIDQSRTACLRKGVRHCEMSWILDNNTAMRGILEASGSQLDKTYRLYRQTL